MLRRPPTKITLTQEDLASFDERKAKRDHQKRQEEYLAAMNSQNSTNLENGAKIADVSGASKKDARSRAQRIGL